MCSSDLDLRIKILISVVGMEDDCWLSTFKYRGAQRQTHRQNLLHTQKNTSFREHIHRVEKSGLSCSRHSDPGRNPWTCSPPASPPTSPPLGPQRPSPAGEPHSSIMECFMSSSCALLMHTGGNKGSRWFYVIIL